MKYAVLKNVNGTFLLDSEWNENLNGAIVQFHSACGSLWNAPDAETATVEIINSQLEPVPGYREFISHPVQA